MKKSTRKDLIKTGVLAILAVSGLAVVWSMLLAAAVSAEVMTEQTAKYLVIVLSNLGVMAAAYITAVKSPQYKLPAAVSFGAACAVLAVLSGLANGIQTDWRMALPFAAALTAGVRAGEKRRNKRR